MRIALFTETYLPYINGVVTHVKLLREGLEKLGHTVLVVTSDPNTHHHYIEDGVLHCPAVKLKKIYGYGLASPYSHTRTKLLEEFHPDIIHIHTEFSMGISGIHIATSSRCRWYIPSTPCMTIICTISQGTVSFPSFGVWATDTYASWQIGPTW